VRETLDRVTLPDCRDLVARSLALSTADEVRQEVMAFRERAGG
jgi:hypothetical protein